MGEVGAGEKKIAKGRPHSELAFTRRPVLQMWLGWIRSDRRVAGQSNYGDDRALDEFSSEEGPQPVDENPVWNARGLCNAVSGADQFR
jgi:hypothetical protein